MTNQRPCFVTALIILLLSAFCLLPSAFSQSATATISGTVEDPNGAVVPGATVTVINVNTNLRRQTTTNESGYFTVPLLPPATYTMRIEHQGFLTAEVNNITLNVGDERTVRIPMKVGDVKETVNITGEESLISQSPAVGTVVDRQFVANIPLNGRSLQSLISLTPGVVSVPPIAAGQGGEFSVNGQRTESNYYTVDGVAANTGTFPAPGGLFASGVIPGLTALGTTQSLVSLDALQEFRIQTSTYSAEFGRMPGGQISLVTRSGTNAWHGSAFDYLRNSVFDANNWFNNANRLPKTTERQNDFGGTLGGPVAIPRLYNGHNKTFFFLSYEGLRLVVPQPAQTAFVPMLALRQAAPAGLQPVLNAFPLPNGPAIGITGMAQFTSNYSAPASIDATSIRVDHSIGNKFTLFASYRDSDSSNTSRTNLTFLVDTIANTKALTTGATAQITSHLVNDLRLNVTWNRNTTVNSLDSFGGAVPISLGDIKDASGQPTPGLGQFRLFLNFGGGASLSLVNQDNYQRQLNIVDGLSYVTGPHRLKFGIDYRRLVSPIYSPNLFESSTFNSQAQVRANQVASGSLILSRANIAVGPLYHNFSLYAQDEWQKSSRLSLSLGLRWDVNPPAGDAYGNLPYTLDQITNLAIAKVAARGTPLWKTTYRNFAPRLGAAYQLRQKSGSEMVIRGGFGVFYDVGNAYGNNGYSGLGFSAQLPLLNVPFPFTSAQLNSVPAPSVAAPYNSTVFAYDPHLQLPYTLEWNLGVEQGLGKSQVLKLTYVGSAGRRLWLSRLLKPNTLGNPNFTATGNLNLAINRTTSDYDALQVQFERRLSLGLQALVSYTWSHSIDEVSLNTAATQIQRASSNFDIRHNFQAAITYNIPSPGRSRLARAVFGNWSIGGRLFGRSGLPFDINGGSTFNASGFQQLIRANLVPGQPLYISDPTAPGGRRVNFNAFTIPPAAQQAAGNFGDAPRNLIRGFAVWQLDPSIRREFRLTERLKLQFHAEAFNIFNHPNFGAIRTTLTSGSALFGVAIGTTASQLSSLNALYQVGGPRSFQFALRMQF